MKHSLIAVSDPDLNPQPITAQVCFFERNGRWNPGALAGNEVKEIFMKEF